MLNSLDGFIRQYSSVCTQTSAINPRSAISRQHYIVFVLRGDLASTRAMTMRIVLVVMLVIGASSAFAQQTTTVRGRVIAAGNRQPLRRALVSIPERAPQVPPGIPLPPPRDPGGVLTDDEGRFEIAIGESARTLVASKGGYAPASIEISRKRTPNDEITIQLA